VLFTNFQQRKGPNWVGEVRLSKEQLVQLGRCGDFLQRAIRAIAFVHEHVYKVSKNNKGTRDSTIYLKHGCHSTFLLETYSPNKEESEKKNEIVQACCVYHHHHPQKVKKIQNIEENGHKNR
jgi:hypothetical protein